MILYQTLKTNLKRSDLFREQALITECPELVLASASAIMIMYLYSPMLNTHVTSSKVRVMGITLIRDMLRNVKKLFH